MIITCPKCRKMSDIKLNPVTDDVVCMSCKSVLSNITIFIKNSLRANRDFVKNIEGKQPFSVKCNHCGREVQPQGEHSKCPECNKEIKLTKFFKDVIRNK